MYRLLYLQLFALLFFVGQPAKGSAVNSSISRPKQVYIENRGQWDADVLFLAQTPGLDVWVTRTGVVYDAFTVEYAAENKQKAARRRGSVVRMEFAQASLTPTPSGQNEVPTRYSYFTENGPAADARLFNEAAVRQVYNGIDVLFYFDGGVPRYDCIVHPGADYSQIAMVMHGAETVQIDDNGSLVLHTPDGGAITQQGLAAYQIVNGSRRYIPCSFVLKDTLSKQPVVGFSMGSYDPLLPVVIDPLVYTAFLGGTELDEMVDIAIDQAGSVYVVGTTMSRDFPHTVGAYDEIWSGRDVVVTKLNNSGTGVVFSTFFGGSGDERAYGLTRDRNGYLYIVGETYSTDLPVDRYYTYSSPFPEGANVFVAKINASGTHMRYVTLIGGDGDDQPAAIAVDDAGNVYITGTTSSAPFPTYPNTGETNRGGTEAFIFSLNGDGIQRYSTVISGTGDDAGTAIAADPRGMFFWIGGVTNSRNLPTTDLSEYQGTGGYYMFFARYRTTGEKELLGYAGVGTARATSIAVDDRGDAYLAGYTPDGSFELPVPLIQPQYDRRSSLAGEGILLKITPQTKTGSITYSTYLGADYDDIINDIAIDRNGAVVMVGSTTEQGVQDSLFHNPKPDMARSTKREGFIAVLTPGERLLSYSTYLGGSSNDECVAVAIARDSSLYVVGNTTSQDLYVSLGSPEYAGKQDGMVARAEYIPRMRFQDDGRIIDFGTVYKGDSREESTVFLNTGVNTIEVEKMIFPTGTPFSTNLVIPSTIPVGAPTGELPVAFTFSPSVPGTFTTTVQFEVRYLKKTFSVTLRGVCIEKPPPVLVLNPDTLRFGQVFTGDHAEESLVISNIGMVSAAVENIVVSGGPAFSYSGSTSLTIGIGGEKGVRIDFDPTAAGVTSAVVRVYVEQSTTPIVAVVEGVGIDRPRPNVYLETYDADLGKVQLGRSKKSTVVISNTGETSATLSIEDDGGVFTGTLDEVVLQPSSSVGLGVFFTPVEAGSTQAQIRLHIQELSTTLVLTVTGEGVFPAAVVLPRDTVDFGEVNIGDSRSDKIFIRNVGIDTLRIAGVGIVGGGFTLRVDTPVELGVDDELEVNIDFAPTNQGSRSETAEALIDHLPDPVAFVLTGIGIQDNIPPRGIAAEPDTLDYGAVYLATTATRRFVVSNISTTQSIEIRNIEIVQSGSEFGLPELREPPYTIPAGESDTITVSFSPVTTAAVTAFARVVSAVNTVVVELLGRGDVVPVPVADTVRMLISDIEAKIGEYREVRLLLSDPDRDLQALQRAGVTGFGAMLRWNSSVMIPVDGHSPGTVKAGVREVEINGAFSSTVDSVFYRLPVRVLWGDAEYTDIRITDFTLYPEEVAPSAIVVDRSDTARLRITDIWHDRDGPRLINPYTGPLTLHISPNPFGSEAVLSVGNAKSSSSLVIYNLLGEAVRDLSHLLTGEDSVDIPLTRSMFNGGGGVYYCRLVSGTHTIVRTLLLRSQQP